MSYEPIVKKTLKVKKFFVTRPTNISSYNVGNAFSFESILNTRSHDGNMSGISFDTNTNTNDTIILPSGRYFVQCALPVPEPAFSSNSANNSATVEWQNFSSTSLNGTYTSFGNKGRNNPGYRPNDTGDNAGVHSYSSGIVESSNTIYLQARIIANNNYSVFYDGKWSAGEIIVWSTN